MVIAQSLISIPHQNTSLSLYRFDRWIRSIDSYSGPDLTYLNPKGEIPDSAVRKLGEQRSNPFREKRLFDSTDFTNESALKNVEIDIQLDDNDDGGGADEEEEGQGVDKEKLAEMEG